MTEETAGIPYLLGEQVAGGKAIGMGQKHQRMLAPHADVIVHPVAIRQPHIRVMAEETGQGVTYVRGGAVFGQVFGAAGNAGRGRRCA